MAILTVHNRFREPFVGMWDGQVYEVGDKDMAFPDYIARHLRKQSILRENPVTGDNLYQLAVIEDGDDTSPIDEKPIDPFDRSDTDSPRTKVIPSGVNRVPRAPRDGAGASAGTFSKER